MTGHLVLILAYHFPPANAIGGARPFRFSKYLSRLGYTCHVLTAADQAGRDDSNTEYVPDPFVTNPRRGLGWQLERVAQKALLPGDLNIRWSYHASRAARAHIRAQLGARVTIFSTFPPLGPHLAAWQLARSERVPWIADFRDPLADLWIDQDIWSYQKQAYQWLERALVRRADAVIVNTDAARVRWQEKFPSLNDRIHLIWNGFDPEERIQPLPVPPRDYKLLSHIGELYSGRNVAPILESLARLIAAGRLAAENVRVRLIGPVQPDSIPGPEFIHRAKTEGWLDLVTEQIPQSEARQIAQTSDGLLLLQPQSAVQVPGKLFEYLKIGRPILAFVQPNSPAERLLERSDVPYRCVYPGNTPEAIDDAVAGFFDLPSTAVNPSPWFEEHFNAERQTQVLDTIIRSVHSGQPRRALTSPIPHKGLQTTRTGDSTDAGDRFRTNAGRQ